LLQTDAPARNAATFRYPKRGRRCAPDGSGRRPRGRLAPDRPGNGAL